MSTSDSGGVIRVFSYLPNPRLYKATIAARYSGATVELVGASPPELLDWLWDYDARPLEPSEKEAHTEWAREARRGFRGAVYKTDAFLEAHPYGNVPAGFADDGRVGVFESNSIMRAAARAGSRCPELYGPGPALASRIDGFLDRTLLFADPIQRYLLSGRSGVNPEIHGVMAEALETYLEGIEAALDHGSHVAADHTTLADIAFVCEIALLSNERTLAEALEKQGLEPVLAGLAAFPRAAAHLRAYADEPRFAEDLAPYFEVLSQHAWW